MVINWSAISLCFTVLESVKLLYFETIELLMFRNRENTMFFYLLR